MTEGQLKRDERDYVIAAAAVHGCPEDLLARVFQLARSRIHNIIVEMCVLHEELMKHRESQRESYREAFRLRVEGGKRERPLPEE